MQLPIYRHLTEKRWREDGALDLLVRFFMLFWRVTHRAWHPLRRNTLAYAICHKQASL